MVVYATVYTSGSTRAVDHGQKHYGTQQRLGYVTDLFDEGLYHDSYGNIQPEDRRHASVASRLLEISHFIIIPNRSAPERSDPTIGLAA